MFLLPTALVLSTCLVIYASLIVTPGDTEAPPDYVIKGVGEHFDPRKHLGDSPNYDWGWNQPQRDLRVTTPSQSLTSITCVPANYGKDNNPRPWR
jgi:hypothetical protein